MAQENFKRLEFFSVPQIRDKENRKGELRPKRVGEWLATLPAGNSQDSTKQIYQALYAKNRLDIDATTRLAVMELICPHIDRHIQTLQRSYVSSPLPLSKRNQSMVGFVNRALLEMAIGYKILLNQYLKDGINAGNHQSVVLSCYRVQQYLSKVMLNNYSIYTPLPAGVWRDFHLVYRIGETHNLLNVPVRGDAAVETKGFATLLDAYNQILLLAASEPFGLQQGECVKAYALFGNWASTISIRKKLPKKAKVAQFVFALNRDSGPVDLNKVEKLSTDSNIRFVNFLEVVREIHNELKLKEKLLAQEESGDQGMAQLFTQVNSLRRLVSVLGKSTRRQSTRSEVKIRVSLCSGINAIHFFSDAAEVFNGQEQNAEQASSTAVESTDNVVDLATVERSLNLSSVYIDLFSSPNSTGEIKPVKKLHPEDGAEEDGEPGTEQPHPDPVGLDTSSLFRIIESEVVDECAGGLRLQLSSSNDLRLNVGDILGIRYESDNRFHAGLIRWLKNHDGGVLDIGIHLLSPVLLPVAVQRVDHDSDSAPLQALLLPGNQKLQQPESLIVPSGSYHMGNELRMTMQEENKRLIKPLRLLHRTRNYDQVLIAPVVEQELVSATATAG